MDDFDCEHPRTLRRALEDQRKMKEDIRAMQQPDMSLKVGPVEARTRGYRVMDLLMVLGVTLAGILAWTMWQHLEQSINMQKRQEESLRRSEDNIRSFEVAMLKSFSDQTAAITRMSADIRFQTCVQAVEPKERIMQLRRNSACWWMGQGYAYEELGKDRPK